MLAVSAPFETISKYILLSVFANYIYFQMKYLSLLTFLSV